MLPRFRLNQKPFSVQMREMRPGVFIAVLLCQAGTAMGQSGFSADLLHTTSSLDGLLATESPLLYTGRFETSLGVDWAYHVLGLQPSQAGGPEWIVEHRLSMRVTAGYSPSGSVRLAAGFVGVLLQEGHRFDDRGARTPLHAGMGTSWLTAVWAVPIPADGPVHLALASTLMLPTATPEGLSGGNRMDVRLLLLASARLWLFRPVVNLGVASRARTRYANLVRDDGILYRIGTEFYADDWPVAATLELAGETSLATPFSSGINETLEALIGLKIKRLSWFEIHVGSGLGILGAGTPAVRALVTLRWADRMEKRDGKVE
jgi:hypothetical protein